MTDLVGQSIGRYHILEQLGQGGMATVYKAYDTRLERDVALKIIRRGAFPPESLDRVLKRFEREAKALAKLSHPTIVKVHDYGEYEGSPYLVLEYLPSGTLKQKMGKPMPWQEAVRLLAPIASALEYAHKHDIIHRDIKPSNILIADNGQPMLSDFGVAKLLDNEETMELTGTGLGVGTPEYMAPEQASSKSIDQRADIYALGVVFYEMVTGRKPYTADTPMAVIIKHASEPLPRPKQFVPNLPDGVEKILLKALAKNPADRYQSMGKFASALEELFSRAPTMPQSAPPGKRAVITQARSSHLGGSTSKVPAEPHAGSPHANKSSTPHALLRNWRTILAGLLVVIILVSALFVVLHRPSTLPVGTEPPVVMETLTATEAPTAVATELPKATATPVLAIGSTRIRPADGMTMMYVPEGNFIMGWPDNAGNSYQHPQHTVYLDAFWMDKTEVTNGMYALCVQAGTCQQPRNTSSYTRKSYYGNPQYDKYPVIYVDWSQANTYCGWAGARLPTEAEWEKAAQGTNGWTNPSIAVTNYNNTKDKGSCVGCVGDTSPVGNSSNGASPYGVLDMVNINVYEWVADWFGENYYANSPSSNPQGPASGVERVLRGGSMKYDMFYLRSGGPPALDPTFASYSVGFRCSRSQ